MKTTPRHGWVFTLARPPGALAKNTQYQLINSSIGIKGGTTYLHVVSALPTGGAPHAILRSRQNKQAIAGLRRALRFVDGNFNTPCPALGFGTNVGVGSVGDDVVVLSMRVTLDVGVPVSEDENDDERGVGMRAPAG